MIKTSSLILTTLLFTLGGSSLLRADSPADSWLFRKFPVTHTCTLAGGEKLAYPLQVYKGNQLSLIGTVALKPAPDFLPKNGLYRPAGFKLPGMSAPRGVLLIQAIDYLDTNLIPYHEFLFNFVVEPTESGLPRAEHAIADFLRHPFSLGNFGVFYMFKLFLNQELPTRAGWELGRWAAGIAP